MTESTAEKHSEESASVGGGTDEPIGEESNEGDTTDQPFDWVETEDVKSPTDASESESVDSEGDASELAATDVDEADQTSTPGATTAPASMADQSTTAETAPETTESERAAVDATAPDRSTAGVDDSSSGVFGRIRSKVGGLF